MDRLCRDRDYAHTITSRSVCLSFCNARLRIYLTGVSWRVPHYVVIRAFIAARHTATLNNDTSPSWFNRPVHCSGPRTYIQLTFRLPDDVAVRRARSLLTCFCVDIRAAPAAYIAGRLLLLQRFNASH